MPLRTAILALTYRCNSRCRTCDIWKKPHRPEIPPEAYRRLPSGLLDIDLTGGETLLRDDLVECIRVVNERCPDARLVLQTNGLLTERLRKRLPEILAVTPRPALRVSLDGLQATHDAIRDVPGGFDRAVEALRIARAAGVADVAAAFTICDSNVGEMFDVYELAGELGVGFTVIVPTDSEEFYGTNKEELRPQDAAVLHEQMEKIRRAERRSWRPRRWFKAWFLEGVEEYARGQPRPLTCNAAGDFVYINPYGDVFPCHLLSMTIGNLLEHTMEEILASEQAVKARDVVAACPKSCWMMCTAKSEIRKQWLSLAWRLVRDKAASL